MPKWRLRDVCSMRRRSNWIREHDVYFTGIALQTGRGRCDLLYRKGIGQESTGDLLAVAYLY